MILQKCEEVTQIIKNERNTAVVNKSEVRGMHVHEL